MSLINLDEYSDFSKRKKRRIIRLVLATAAIFIVAANTLAGNYSINSGNKIEFGQGAFRVSACDGFISVNFYPTAATYSGLSRIQTVELVGLNAAKCNGKLLRLKVYGSTGNTAKSLYYGVSGMSPGSPATLNYGSADTLALVDTSTVYNSSTMDYPTYMSKALNLVNMAGINDGYKSDYYTLSYNKNSGTYKIYLVQPLCLISDVYRITIETAPLT